VNSARSKSLIRSKSTLYS